MPKLVFIASHPTRFVLDGREHLVNVRKLRSNPSRYGIFVGSGRTPLSTAFESRQEALVAWHVGFDLNKGSDSKIRRAYLNELIENGLARLLP